MDGVLENQSRAIWLQKIILTSFLSVIKAKSDLINFNKGIQGIVICQFV